MPHEVRRQFFHEGSVFVRVANKYGHFSYVDVESTIVQIRKICCDRRRWGRIIASRFGGEFGVGNWVGRAPLAVRLNVARGLIAGVIYGRLRRGLPRSLRW